MGAQLVPVVERDDLALYTVSLPRPSGPAPRLPAGPMAQAYRALTGAAPAPAATAFVAFLQAEQRDAARGGRPACATLLWHDEAAALVARSVCSAEDLEELGNGLLALARDMHIHAEGAAQGERHPMPRATLRVMPGLRLGETRDA